MIIQYFLYLQMKHDLMGGYLKVIFVYFRIKVIKKMQNSHIGKEKRTRKKYLEKGR